MDHVTSDLTPTFTWDAGPAGTRYQWREGKLHDDGSIMGNSSWSEPQSETTARASFNITVKPVKFDRLEPNPASNPTDIGPATHNTVLDLTSSASDRDWYRVRASQAGILSVEAVPSASDHPPRVRIRRDGATAWLARARGRVDVLAQVGEVFAVSVRVTTADPIFYDLGWTWCRPPAGRERLRQPLRRSGGHPEGSGPGRGSRADG